MYFIISAVAGHPDMETSFSIFHVLQFYGIFHIKMPLFKSQILCLLSFMHAVHTKLGCLPFDMRKGLYKLHKNNKWNKYQTLRSLIWLYMYMYAMQSSYGQLGSHIYTILWSYI